MKQPEGYEHQNNPNHVCKIDKALYGLKQAPRAWYDKLSQTLLLWGFQNAKSDTLLFFLQQNQKIVLVLIYVDDIVITRNDNFLLDKFTKNLNSCFSLKDMG